MPLARDNSDIPRTAGGNPPDAEPRFGHLLAEAWAARSQETHQKSRADVEHYIRLGWAGKCARDIGYRLTDTPPSNPTDVDGYWRMGLGTMVHEQLQDVITELWPHAEVEKVVGAESDETFGFPASGRTDLFIIEFTDEPRPGKRISVEFKTVNGFGFKSMIGANKGPAEGPKTGALFQAALNGRAHGADEVVIVYLAFECLSDRVLDTLVAKNGGTADASRKFIAEWTYAMSDLDEMVDHELGRLKQIVRLVDAGELAPRFIPLEMPPRSRIVNPATGAWEQAIDGNVLRGGTTWWCQYCNYRDICTADGPS
jgi:hypothetical protein